jgi:hypothetical protein
MTSRREPYANRDPSASIYSGRTLLGFVIDEPGQCAALAPERALIGLFPDRKAATLAILLHPTGRQPPDGAHVISRVRAGRQQ